MNHADMKNGKIQLDLNFINLIFKKYCFAIFETVSNFDLIFRGPIRDDVPDQPMDISEPANQRETKFVETFLKAAENVEMTDQDVEIAENHGTEFKHDSLMEYSNIQLDFIKVFGERVFVMVIGKLSSLYCVFNHVIKIFKCFYLSYACI